MRSCVLPAAWKTGKRPAHGPGFRDGSRRQAAPIFGAAIPLPFFVWERPWLAGPSSLWVVRKVLLAHFFASGLSPRRRAGLF